MLALLLALATAAAAPPPADPPPADPEGVFDRLFGSEPERADASAEARAGRDDLALVGLVLGGARLREDVPAYRTPDGLCLPLEATLDALELAHAPDGADEVVRLFAPARTLRIAAADIQASPGGRCLALPAWSRVLPARFRYDAGNLRVAIEAAEPLPVAERLAREARRQAELRPEGPARPAFPAIDNPWRWLSPPTLDLTLGGEISARGPIGAAVLEASGDVLKASGRARLTLDAEGRADLRLSLGRAGEAGELPFGLRAAEIGDIAAPAQPLLADPAAGRGLILTSRPAWRADLFDRIELRGPLPRGWDAELYRDDQLLAVAAAPDAAGDWVFAEVPLRTGYNRFVVRLYGPNGETDAREFVRVIGAELYPENETRWTVGLIDPGRPLIGPREGRAAPAPAAFASVERGLSDRLTARIDLRAPLGPAGRPGVSAGLHAGLLGGYGSLLVASDGRGRPPLALRAGRRFGASELSFEAFDYGTAPAADRPVAVRALRRGFGLGVATRVALGRRSAPLQLSLTRAEERSGVSITRLDSQLGLALGPARLAHRLSGEWRPGETLLLGSLGGTMAAGRWRLRGGLDYRLAPVLRPEQLQLALSRAGPRGSLSAEAGWDFRRRGPVAGIGVNRALGSVLLAANLGVGTGGWRAGLSLGFSLYRGSGAWRIGGPGLGRTAAIQPMLFVDEDGDGRPGAGDRPVEGGRFVVDASIRPEATGADGAGLLTGLAPGRPIEIEPQLASLPDLALRPVRPGARVRLRPGQLLQLPVPLRPTGEIEARVLARRGDFESPLPGVAVLLSTEAGDPVARTVSDFDGYAYFDGVAFGRYRLALDQTPEVGIAVALDASAAVATGLSLYRSR